MASGDRASRPELALLDFSRDARYRCPNPTLVIVGGNPSKAPTTSVHVVLHDAVVLLHEAQARKARSG